MQEVGLDVAILEDHGGDCAGGSVGAIHQHAQFAEAARADQRRQPLGILRTQLGLTGQHAISGSVCLRSACRELLDVGKDVGFDGMLELVGQLVTVGAENLDAIVVPGIVRGGNHDARSESVLARQVGDARRGDHTGADDRALRSFEPAAQYLADPGAGLTSVLPDYDARMRIALGKTLTQCAANGVHCGAIQRIFVRRHHGFRQSRTILV